jgi:hypothetical protein
LIEDRVEHGGHGAADWRELNEAREPGVEVIYQHDRPAERDRPLQRPREVGDVAMQHHAKEEDDRVDRIDVEAQIADEDNDDRSRRRA